MNLGDFLFDKFAEYIAENDLYTPTFNKKDKFELWLMSLMEDDGGLNKLLNEYFFLWMEQHPDLSERLR